MNTGARADLQSALPRLQQLGQAGGGASGDQALPPGAARTAWTLVAGVLAPLATALPAPDDSGYASALVSSLRQQGLSTLDEAHALLDLHALAAREGPDGAAPTASGSLPRQLIDRATAVLQRIVATASASETTASLGVEYSRAAAAGRAGAGAADAPRVGAASSSSAYSAEQRGAARAGATGTAPTLPAESTSGGRSSAFVVGLVIVCLLAAGVAAALFTGVGRSSPLEQGIAAYEAGQRVVARIAFEEAMAKDPTDPMPLVYLGRLSREEGDVAQARALLEQAVTRAPDNALTHRELAAALLADNEPELARRFYVRALTIDPNDRLAQGFLGCALARLGRADEAARWLERAGPGDWTVCANSLPDSLRGSTP